VSSYSIVTAKIDSDTSQTPISRGVKRLVILHILWMWHLDELKSVKYTRQNKTRQDKEKKQ